MSLTFWEGSMMWMESVLSQLQIFHLGWEHIRQT